MRLAVASLAIVAVLTLAADRALAEGALSYPMAAHVAARYGVQHPGHNREVMRNMQAERGHHGSSRHHANRYRQGPGRYYGRGPRYPVVVVPSPWMYNRYYTPYRGFAYFAPASAFGFGF